MEGGLINPLALIRTGAAKGVTSVHQKSPIDLRVDERTPLQVQVTNQTPVQLQVAETSPLEVDGTYQESCPLGVLKLNTVLQGTPRCGLMSARIGPRYHLDMNL